MERDVRWIITPQERAVFLELSDNALRERFIKEFWERRDPTPGTPANEFRELHYQRLERAGSEFGRNTPRPGWQTDQGKIFILLGEPVFVERYPNNKFFWPIEIWAYDHARSHGINHPFRLLFLQRNGIGEYRLWRPGIDGFNALFIFNPLRYLFLEDMYRIRNRLRDPVATDIVDAVVSQTQGGSRLGADVTISRAESPPEVDLTGLRSVLDTSVTADFTLHSLPVEFSYALSDPGLGGMRLDLSIGLSPAQVTFEETDGSYYASLEVIGTVHEAETFPVASWEDRVDLQFTAEEFAARRHLPLSYQRAIHLLPGRYQLRVVIRNIISRGVGHFEETILVPRRNPGALSLGTPMLSYNVMVREPGDTTFETESAVTPFKFGSLELRPQPANHFAPNSTPTLVYQVYLPAEIGTAPDAELAEVLPISDALTDPARLIARYRLQTVDALILEDTDQLLPVQHRDGQILTIGRPLSLEGVPEGSYTLEVTIEAEGQTVATTGRPIEVSAVAPSGNRVTAAMQPSTTARAQYSMGRQALERGDVELAIDLLRAATIAEPQLSLAQLELGRALLLADQAVVARDVLSRATSLLPDDVRAWLSLGLAALQLEEYGDALVALERAEQLGPETPAVLNALARAHHGVGDDARAHAYLAASLQIDPEQPEIRTWLEEGFPKR